MTLPESNPRYLTELHLEQYRPGRYQLESDVRNARETADFIFFRQWHGGTDEVVKEVQKELGDNLSLLVKAGERELEERAQIHERLYRILPLSAIINQKQRERMFGTGEDSIVKSWHLTNRFPGLAQLINMSSYSHFSPGDIVQRARIVLDDLNLFSTASSSSLKYGLELRARVILKVNEAKPWLWTRECNLVL